MNAWTALDFCQNYYGATLMTDDRKQLFHKWAVLFTCCHVWEVTLKLWKMDIQKNEVTEVWQKNDHLCVLSDFIPVQNCCGEATIFLGLYCRGTYSSCALQSTWKILQLQSSVSLLKLHQIIFETQISTPWTLTLHMIYNLGYFTDFSVFQPVNSLEYQ